MWLIVSDRAIRGFARTGPSPDPDLPARAGEVHGLYVDPDRIGTGHGRRLFVHALADLVVRDLRPVVVWHFAANDRAARFYERAGLPLDGGRHMSEFGVEELRRRRGSGPRQPAAMPSATSCAANSRASSSGSTATSPCRRRSDSAIRTSASAGFFGSSGPWMYVPTTRP